MGKQIKGWYLENGYKMIKSKGHPFANKRGYVAEHRLVAEQYLGRNLEKGEILHHIDGNRQNNNWSNLKLITVNKHHSEHNPKRNPNGQFIASEPIFTEIKFRLYDADKKITQIYTLQELISKTFRRGKFKFRGRWTSLKDKNGKEIYEGDILQWIWDHPDDEKYDPRNERYEVIFTKGAFMTVWKINDETEPELIEKPEEYEVIGNIYENPGLLK